VSIGETLSHARREAGLSIAAIGRQTGMRHSVIDDIEHDDFSSSGGDLYARGNIRAIARVLGVDSRPLIDAYDANRQPDPWIAAAKPSDPFIMAEAPEVHSPWQEPEPVTVSDDTVPIKMGNLPEPITTAEQSDPTTIVQPSDPIRTAGSVLPAWASGPARMTLADRRPSIWIELGAALLAVGALGGILFVLGANGRAVRHATVAGHRHRSNARDAAHSERTRRSSADHSAGSPGPGTSALPASGRSARALVPASITAFGPGGTGHGDSPQLAHQALAGNAAAPWHSDWYTTPRFGNLQSGTGLLLDMGRMVTITSARIALGNRSGANLALRIGNSPTLASLPPAARAKDVGGAVLLSTAPTRGRYVLIWFTKLPPDQSGTFQISVYRIRLHGYP